jgi:hypothetical protein
MSEQRRDEKDEKEEEKRREKDEKSWEEKWRRDMISAITWALIFIWGGLVLLAGNLGFAGNFRWWEGWAVFFTGMGTIIIVMALIRLLLPEYRQPITGNIILGVIFLGIGLGGLLSWAFVWPVVLIIIGLVILLRGAIGRR